MIWKSHIAPPSDKGTRTNPVTRIYLTFSGGLKTDDDNSSFPPLFTHRKCMTDACGQRFCTFLSHTATRSFTSSPLQLHSWAYLSVAFCIWSGRAKLWSNFPIAPPCLPNAKICMVMTWCAFLRKRRKHTLLLRKRYQKKLQQTRKKAERSDAKFH